MQSRSYTYNNGISANQAFLFNVLNDDGTRIITSYDPGNASDTQEIVTGYDALGSEDYSDTHL